MMSQRRGDAPRVSRGDDASVVVTLNACDYHVLLAAARRGCKSYRDEHSGRMVHAVEDLLLYLERTRD